MPEGHLFVPSPLCYTRWIRRRNTPAFVVAFGLAIGCGSHPPGHKDAGVPDAAVPGDMASPSDDLAKPATPLDFAFSFPEEAGSGLVRPFGPWIAFASNRAGNFDLFLVHPDGSAVNPLVQTAGEELFPAWSPDGAKVVFASNQSGAYQLYAVEVTTGIVTPIPTGIAAATAPAYSPDGVTIAFGGNGDAIYVVPAAGGNAIPLTDGMHRDNSPAWAPDGSVIYFSSDRSGTFEVWSMKPDGSALTQVTTGTNLLGGPAVSPDGKTLAMAKSSTQTTVIFWDLAMQTQSTFSSMGDTEPSFAKSGTQLAVTSTRYGAGNPEIVILGVPGAATPFRLTNDPGVDGQAAIQPVQ
jgi:Tol biopolymer transport system component